MDGLIYNAVVLRAADYGEADKTLDLYTLEAGRISAVIKGVKKPKAKLKPAAQPFCFGEYTLSKRDEYYTVTGCTLQDNFYDLAFCVDKFFAGCCMLEAALLCTEKEIADKDIFVFLLRILKELCYSDAPAETVLTKFFMEFLRLSGYRLSFDACAVCREQPRNPSFDAASGGVVCASCAAHSVPLEPAAHGALRIISGIEPEKLSSLRLNEAAQKTALNIAYSSFKYHLKTELKAFIRL